MINVRAIKVGFYGNQIRLVDSRFEIADKTELGSWMVLGGDEEKLNRPSKPLTKKELEALVKAEAEAKAKADAGAESLV